MPVNPKMSQVRYGFSQGQNLLKKAIVQKTAPKAVVKKTGTARQMVLRSRKKLKICIKS
jgi:hypothetical protein